MVFLRVEFNILYFGVEYLCKIYMNNVEIQNLEHKCRIYYRINIVVTVINSKVIPMFIQIWAKSKSKLLKIMILK